MKIFQCKNCYLPVFFDNTGCEKCGSSLGYLDVTNQIYALNPNHAEWEIEGINYQYCKNKSLGVCNWLVPKNSDHGYCTSCRLNRTIPDISLKDNYENWKQMELAKRRLVYSLQRLNLPILSKLDDPEKGLCFDFLSKEVAEANGKNVMTGHINGIITILLREADSVTREQMRKTLNEFYRTLIGHFRHEVGHYYWNLIFPSNFDLLEKFRVIFGNEQQDYAEALKKHYESGAPENWKQHYISAYASAHPWEDWAETWAHYMHIMDSEETAHYFGLGGSPRLANAPHMQINSFDPYENVPFKNILDGIAPLFYAVNSINRSMGIADVYPFVISTPVQNKLEFIHQILQTFIQRH